jgi:hypothetical protein
LQELGIIQSKSLKDKVNDVPIGEAVKSPEELEIERENERKEYEEVLALGKSMWLTDLFVQKPWTVILVGAAIIGLFSIVCVSF